MPRLPRSRRDLVALAVAVGLGAVAVGCGGEVGRTALVPGEPRWITPTTVEFVVECADEVEVIVQPGEGFEFLPLVTIWGSPNRNGCRTHVEVVLPPGTDRIDDAASGRVIDLPPSPGQPKPGPP